MIILVIIISLSLLILVHELGHFLTAKFFGVRVEEFGLGFPPRLVGKKIGETLYSINLLPFGGFVKIFGEDGENNEDKDQITSPPQGIRFVDRPIWQRSLIVLAGVFMNVILGWFVFSLIFWAGAPSHLLIAEVFSSSPAESAGLKDGDVILEVRSGETIFRDPVPSKDFVNLVTGASGSSFEMKVMRGEEVIGVEVMGRENPPEGQGPLGISLVDIGFEGVSLGRSFVRGFETTISTLKLVTVGFFNFFSRILISPEVLESVAGPVGIFTIASQAGSLGIIYLFQLMAFISVNLAVLNLIPFPALDGGRFLLLIIEKIKGSPLSRKIQVALNAAGFAILIILMILITVQDIGRLIR